MAHGEPTRDRLGSYVLPGGVRDPLPGTAAAVAVEAMGLGTVWIGERYDTKDLPSLAGAISQVTSRVRIAAGITHTGLRHPMVLASMGQTLQGLSGGRFMLGLGRSAEWRWRMYGVPAPTLQSLGDAASILRRLWGGETVSYEGPLGTFPELRLPQRPDQPPPPLLLAAVGPKSLRLAGEFYDGVILHPFLTPDAVRRSCEVVRTAAADAGRDPDGLRCVATVVVAPDLSEEATRRAVHARAAGYFSVVGLGDALVSSNGWDADALARYRAQDQLASLESVPADKALSRVDLANLTDGMPSHWLSSAAAIGSVTDCHERLVQYLRTGADELILHGTTGEALGDLAAMFPTAAS